MTLGLRRLHETFVALAGRLQSIHSQVEMQKDQYLNMRKYFLKDSTNIFDKPESNDDAISKMIAQSQLALPKRAAGPTPFSSLNISTPFSFINQPSSGNVVPQTAPPAYPVLGQPSLSKYYLQGIVLRCSNLVVTICSRLIEERCVEDFLVKYRMYFLCKIYKKITSLLILHFLHCLL